MDGMDDPGRTRDVSRRNTVDTIMVFAPIFQRPFSATFDRRAAAAAGAAWWIGATIAYQPKNSADLAASYINLVTPGTNNIVFGVSPTWTAASGWTSDTISSVVSGVLGGGEFTVAWRGAIANSGYTTIFTSPSGNTGGLLIQNFYGDGNLYVGCNADSTPRFAVSVLPFSDSVIIYQKLADNSQRLFIDGVEVAGSPKAGTAYTDSDIYIDTGNGGKCLAVAAWQSIIDASAISAAMAAL